MAPRRGTTRHAAQLHLIPAKQRSDYNDASGISGAFYCRSLGNSSWHPVDLAEVCESQLTW